MSRHSAGLPPTVIAGRGTRGFSLVELMVVVVIIAVVAALALPSLAQQMQDRRGQVAAQQIATLFRDARMRALARGSAVLVRFTGGTTQTQQRFEVREAVRGGSSQCARLPSPSCSFTDWTNGPTTIGGSQLIESLVLNTQNASGRTGIAVQFDGPGSGTDQASVVVCFSPSGAALINTTGDSTNLTPMTGVPLLRIYRTNSAGSALIGMERRVVVLPNGQARLEVSTGRAAS